MGPIAARKARQVVAHVRQVLAIEVLCASQGLDFLAPLVPGLGVRAAQQAVRRTIPFMEADRLLAGDLPAAERLVPAGALRVGAAEAGGGAARGGGGRGGGGVGAPGGEAPRRAGGGGGAAP